VYSITITPEALSGQAAQVFFAYLREKITIANQCCFMQADKEYLYTPKLMSSEIYTLQVKQSVLCYLSTTSSKEPIEPWYYVNYIDTPNIVGRGCFATVFNISAIYQCTATALTEIPITIPLVVKIQDYCQCETMAKVSCSRHNPKILGSEESRISKTIPHLGVQTVLFNLRTSYTVMLKMPGRPLRDIISDDLKGCNILTFQQRMDITQLLLHALRSQAPDLIHRDIKPANIMVCLESGVVRLIDYQYALRIPPGSDSIQTDYMVGTLNFKAPENSHDNTQPNRSITLMLISVQK
jgi:serine/threonine protein kinase